MKPRQKYVTNRELLGEIHECKKSYNWYSTDDDSNYDYIIRSIDELNESVIKEILNKKCAPRTKADKPKNFNIHDLVFRLMTFDHIPLDPTRKKKTKNNIPYTKLPFPPFKHFRIKTGANLSKLTWEDLEEVGRSHWVGSLSNGEFSLEGRMSNKLASMFMMIVERYARKANFRGYSYNDEMMALALLQLSDVGLQFDESKSNNPFAFYTTVIKHCFVCTITVEKKNQDIRDDMLIMAGTSPSFARQTQNEIEQRKILEAKPVEKGAAGRPKKTVEI